MENVLNLTPIQTLLILALHAWMFIIFPMIVIKKINRLTELLEGQCFTEDQDQYPEE